MSDELYRDRNVLVAKMAADHPSCFGIDESEPDWPVVYIQLPTGQVSFHIGRNDMDLFPHVKRDDSIKWDGHSTDEKNRRIIEYTQRIANAKRLGEREILSHD